VVIYNPSNPATIGTLVSGSRLSLDFNTSLHDNTDILQIFTDDGDTGATEQTLSQLVQIMQDLAERLDVYPDGAGALRTNIVNSITVGSGTISNLSAIGSMTTNLDQIWRPLMQTSAELQNQLFPVT
jgi:hypothetical protein